MGGLLKKSEERITVMGVVVPVEWDDAGHPYAFALSTYDEREFLIDPECLPGKEVIAMPQQKIKVTGTLGGAVNNRRIIRVHAYECMSTAAGGSTAPNH